MLVGSLCGNKRYSLAEMAAVLVMTAGIAHFSLLHVQNTSSAASAAGGEAARGGAHVGVLLLAGSLLMDGATGAVQDRCQNARPTLRPTVLQSSRVSNKHATRVISMQDLLRNLGNGARLKLAREIFFPDRGHTRGCKSCGACQCKSQFQAVMGLLKFIVRVTSSRVRLC